MSGELIVVSGPSGSGKTSLARALETILPNIYFSVSTTTRKIRDGEEDGVDYYFISKEEFLHQIENGDFLEWAEVHGNFYGTSFLPIEKAIEDGKTIILDIDVQGHRSVRERYGDAATSIFITTKNLVVLRERLKNRGTDSAEVIDQRVLNAFHEMKYLGEYDYILVNDSFDETLGALADILSCARHMRSKLDIKAFVDSWRH
jgi:guanylate kinase